MSKKTNNSVSNKDIIANDELENVEEVKPQKKVQVIDEDFEEVEDEEDITMEDRIVNIEKKTNTLLVLMVITVLLVFVTMIFTMSNKGTTTPTPTDESENSSYSTAAFDEIKGTDIAKESKGKTIVVMMGRQGCGYCAAYETFMKDNFGRTPLTLFIKDSKIIGTISGYVDSDELAKQLENNGISKK